MPFYDTPIPGIRIFEPKIWKDERGYFYESYNYNTFKAAGITNLFVQDNESKSDYGVLRGLHYQTGQTAQAKLVRVTEGEILDVVVDIREGSPTYGQSYSLKLNADNKIQLFIPRGFAHGFVVLSKTAVFCYKCDNFYNKESEGGILFDSLNIDWQIPSMDIMLSEKDKELPSFGNHKKFYTNQ